MPAVLSSTRKVSCPIKWAMVCRVFGGGYSMSSDRFVELTLNQALQPFQFFFAHSAVFFPTKDRHPDIPLGIQIEVVDQVLNLLVGGQKPPVQGVVLEQSTDGALPLLSPSSNRLSSVTEASAFFRVVANCKSASESLIWLKLPSALERAPCWEFTNPVRLFHVVDDALECSAVFDRR